MPIGVYWRLGSEDDVTTDGRRFGGKVKVEVVGEEEVKAKVEAKAENGTQSADYADDAAARSG